MSRPNVSAICLLKRRLGELMKEAAEGVGALDRSDTSSSEKCIKDFEDSAGSLIYELFKKVAAYYHTGDVDRYEEGWAAWILAGIVKEQTEIGTTI